MLGSVLSIGQGDGTSGEGPSLTFKYYKATQTYLQWRKFGACPSLSLLEPCDCEEPGTVGFMHIFNLGSSTLSFDFPRAEKRDIMVMLEKKLKTGQWEKKCS